MQPGAGGEQLTLTRKEFSLLVLLARNVGRVLVHSAILSHVWDAAHPGMAESLRVHITNLRRKLGRVTSDRVPSPSPGWATGWSSRISPSRPR